MPSKKQVQPLVLPIEWNVPDGTVARYATNMVVQRLENEFLISFFEILPPMVLGEPSEISKKLKQINSVTANCVAQIIVSAEKMPAFVDALDNSIKRSAEVTANLKVKK